MKLDTIYWVLVLAMCDSLSRNGATGFNGILRTDRQEDEDIPSTKKFRLNGRQKFADLNDDDDVIRFLTDDDGETEGNKSEYYEYAELYEESEEDLSNDKSKDKGGKDEKNDDNVEDDEEEDEYRERNNGLDITGIVIVAIVMTAIVSVALIVASVIKYRLKLKHLGLAEEARRRGGFSPNNDPTVNPQKSNFGYEVENA